MRILIDEISGGGYHAEIVRPPGIHTIPGQEPVDVKTLEELFAVEKRWLIGMGVFQSNFGPVDPLIEGQPTISTAPITKS